MRHPPAMGSPAGKPRVFVHMLLHGGRLEFVWHWHLFLVLKTLLRGGDHQGLLFKASRRELRAQMSPDTPFAVCAARLGAFASLSAPRMGKEKTLANGHTRKVV